MTRVGVIDYGMGNRRSVEKALEHVGAEVAVTGDHDELAKFAGQRVGVDVEPVCPGRSTPGYVALHAASPTVSMNSRSLADTT